MNIAVPPKTRMEKVALAKFVHSFSLNQGGKAISADEVLRVVVANFDVLLPDADGHGKYFEEDFKRLAASLSSSQFVAHLPVLLPKLIKIVENGSDEGCIHGISNQKDLACNFLKYITRNYGDSMVPFFLHLETFVMRSITFSDDGEYAASYMPTLLSCLKNRGATEAAKLWHEYWSALKVEISEARREDEARLIPTFISSVGGCIEAVGRECVTAKEMEEIGQMMKEELDKCVKKKGEGENDEIGVDTDAGKIIKSCALLIDTGCKVIGAPFHSAIRPLLPLLCPLIDESVELDENLKMFIPKLHEKVLLRFPLVDKSRKCQRESSDENGEYEEIPVEKPEKPADQIIMDFPAFCALLKEMDSADEEKSQSASDKFAKISPGLKTSFLLTIANGIGMEALPVNEETEGMKRALKHLSEHANVIPISEITLHVKELFALGRKLIFHEQEDIRREALLMLQRLSWKGWKDIAPLLSGDSTLKLCNALLQFAGKEWIIRDCSSISEVIAEVANGKYEMGAKWKEMLRFVADYCGDSDSLNVKHTAFLIIKLSASSFLSEDDAFLIRLKSLFTSGLKFDEIDDHDTYRFIITTGVLDAFVALVKACEEEEDDRTGSILASLLPILIEMAEVEVASNERYLSTLCALHQLRETKMIRPHLPKILQLTRSALDGGNNNYTDLCPSIIRSIRHQIAYNVIDIRSLETADKSAFVPVEQPLNCEIVVNDDVDMDDELFGKIKKSDGSSPAADAPVFPSDR